MRVPPAAPILLDTPLRPVSPASDAKKTPAEQQSSYAHVWFRLIGFSNNSTHGPVLPRTTKQAGRGPTVPISTLYHPPHRPRLATKASPFH
ncbi:hypothetical protein E2C01_010463 [Portunus trituberculatus]|uniref:Uncharacterized protein n=1 Tax=Portunus trituberculatus TaxID=210409 RepID=A0A5B7D8I4_PORTR|nr:hypothetical protein [Portunus trituberculatus]